MILYINIRYGLVRTTYNIFHRTQTGRMYMKKYGSMGGSHRLMQLKGEEYKKWTKKSREWFADDTRQKKKNFGVAGRDDEVQSGIDRGASEEHYEEQTLSIEPWMSTTKM
jgi:hypothetical protein